MNVAVIDGICVMTDSAQSSNKVKKKNDLLGGLDLNSPEVQKMLKMRSINDGIVSKVDLHSKTVYFIVVILLSM